MSASLVSASLAVAVGIDAAKLAIFPCLSALAWSAAACLFASRVCATVNPRNDKFNPASLC